MNCKLEFLYYVTREKTEYIALHKHKCYELVYYINGTGGTVMEEASYQYSPNTFAIVRPECVHDEKHDMETDVLFIGFQYNGPEISLKNGIYSDDRQQTVFHYLTQIKQELADQKTFFRMKLDLLLKELIIELARIKPASTPKSNNFSYIKRFLEENYNQKIDLNVLANLSGYSYHHFRHLFKQKTGLSPVNFVTACRMSMAKKLLKSGLPVSEVSQSCGFYSESQFSSMFKRETGMPPSVYKKR